MVKNLRDADKFTIGNGEFLNSMVKILESAVIVPLEMKKLEIQW